MQFMIVDFAVENFGPFRDRAVLSMVTAPPDEESYYETEGAGYGLLYSAIVIGPNAAGKTKLFEAMRALVSLTSESFPEDFKYPWYEPFKLSAEKASAPVELRIRFLEDGVLYDYRVAYGADHIVFESLYTGFGGSRALVFERELTDGRDVYCGVGSSIIALTSWSTTFLCTCAGLGEPACERVWKSIHAIRFIWQDSPSPDRVERLLVDQFASDPSFERSIANFLSYMDTGMDGLVVLADGSTHPCGKIMVRHDFGPECEQDLFPLEFESVGILKMLEIAVNMCRVFKEGGALVIDGIDSHLHTDVAKWVVGQFSDGFDPNLAQLVAGICYPELLGMDSMERDHFNFVEKSHRDGASVLYSLGSFEVPYEDTGTLPLDVPFDEISIPQAYRMGMFGACHNTVGLSFIDSHKTEI